MAIYKHIVKVLKRGLILILPLVILVIVLNVLIGLFQWLVASIPMKLSSQYWLGRSSFILDVAVFMVIWLGVGLVGLSPLCIAISRAVDRWISYLPLIRSIYSATKEALAVFLKPKRSFQQVVMIQYPKPGTWSLAFMTNDHKIDVDASHANQGRVDPDDTISVFLPTTPNPTSGFILIVKRAEVIFIDVGIEEALKYIISLGASGHGVMEALSKANQPKANKEMNKHES